MPVIVVGRSRRTGKGRAPGIIMRVMRAVGSTMRPTVRRLAPAAASATRAVAAEIIENAVDHRVVDLEIALRLPIAGPPGGICYGNFAGDVRIAEAEAFGTGHAGIGLTIRIHAIALGCDPKVPLLGHARGTEATDAIGIAVGVGILVYGIIRSAGSKQKE